MGTYGSQCGFPAHLYWLTGESETKTKCRTPSSISCSKIGLREAHIASA